MITLELDPDEIENLRKLIRHHLAMWGLNTDADLTLSIKGTEATIAGVELEKCLTPDMGVDYLNYSFDDAAFEDAWEKGRKRGVQEGLARGFEEKAQVARIEALLHGDAASGRSLAELANDIEHLVQRATEQQDRLVEMERAK